MAGNTFNRFKRSVNRGVTAINLKTSSSLEKAKINTHIETLQEDIDELIVSSGETAYAVWKDGKSDYSVLAEDFQLIQEKETEIEKLHAEIAEIDVRENQILGTEAEEGETAEPIVEDTVACGECGAVYAADVNFCRKCGNKLHIEL